MLLAAVTAGFASYAFVTTTSLFGLRRASVVARRRRRIALLQMWSRQAVRILGVRIETRGAPPEAAAVIVANHLSYLDIIVMCSAMPMTFVAKSEVAGWPVVGSLVSFVDTIYVDRNVRAKLPETASALARRLAEGTRVAFFPEGTTTKGDRVLPFRPALLQPAAEARLPVACAAIFYETPPGCRTAADAVCWWGDMAFMDHGYGMMALPSVQATIGWSDRTIVAGDRKALALQAYALVSAEFSRLSGIPVGELSRRADDEGREAGGVDGLAGDERHPSRVEQLGET